MERNPIYAAWSSEVCILWKDPNESQTLSSVRPAYVIGTPCSDRHVSKERHRSAAAILRQQLPNARVFSVELQKILDKYKQLWDESFFGMNFKEYS